MLLAFVALATIPILAWLVARLRRAAAIGAAYKAKALATALFTAGRDIDPRRAPEVSADSYWPMRFFPARIDPAQRSVTVSLPPFPARTAVHRDLLGACVLGPGSLPAADTSVVSPSSTPIASTPWPIGPRSTRLDAFVDLAFTEPRRRRLRRTRAIVVVRHGQIVAERYAPQFGETTPFAGWSMTKAVAGALIGILIGEGRLSLGDRALLPEWQPPDPRSAIQLEDLLRMRSGLGFDETYRDLSSDVNEMLFNQPDMAGYAASRPLVATPGTQWSYSSGTTNILTLIVRNVVGDDDYAAWPRRVLFDPIGMASAQMEADASGTFVGSSYMLATARDWARFGQLYLDDGVWAGRRVLPEGWVRFSTTPTPESPAGNWGAHWYLKLNPDIGGGTAAAARIAADAFFTIGHEGQTLTVIPSLGLVVVRLGLSIHIDAWNHAEFIAGLQEIL